MKVKSPSETCGAMSREHGYLGHYQQARHLDRGHNDVWPFRKKTGDDLMAETEAALARRKAAEAAAGQQQQVPAAVPREDTTNQRRRLDERIKGAGG